MTQICHPNIVGLYEVEKTPTHYYLILEYCGGGDLQKLIRSRQSGRLSEKLTRRLFRDLTAGLRCLYELQLIHRDIKPQNLLLTGTLPLDELEDEGKEQADETERQKENFPSHLFALKLADFGFARHLQTTSLAETLCGSPLYMAPEILQHQRYDLQSMRFFLQNAQYHLFRVITCKIFSSVFSTFTISGMMRRQICGVQEPFYLKWLLADHRFTEKITLIYYAIFKDVQFVCLQESK